MNIIDFICLKIAVRKQKIKKLYEFYNMYISWCKTMDENVKKAIS